MNLRQRQQQAFDLSNDNIIVGSEALCPISVAQLVETSAASSYVIETFTSGLTAEVFHLRIQGRDYTLKKRRPVAKVNNPDGQYSFLNEVQRRRDFTKLKNDPENGGKYRNIVPTIYANYREGIILSPWIEGHPINHLTPELVKALFATLFACEQAGLFEWDLCSGNMLVDKANHLWLFDFGYMYPFDAKSGFNSNGLSDPIFHFSERFDTRFLFGWFLSKHTPEHEQIAVYRMVKEQALETLEEKRCWLNLSDALPEVVLHTEQLIQGYSKALTDESCLRKQFTLDAFRSHVLDIEDDLEGQSCTPVTLLRVDTVLAMLNDHFAWLEKNGGLFYGNTGKSKEDLLSDYQEKRVLAKQYLIVE